METVTSKKKKIRKRGPRRTLFDQTKQNAEVMSYVKTQKTTKPGNYSTDKSVITVVNTDDDVTFPQ